MYYSTYLSLGLIIAIRNLNTSRTQGIPWGPPVSSPVLLVAGVNLTPLLEVNVWEWSIVELWKRERERGERERERERERLLPRTSLTYCCQNYSTTCSNSECVDNVYVCI